MHMVTPCEEGIEFRMYQSIFRGMYAKSRDVCMFWPSRSTSERFPFLFTQSDAKVFNAAAEIGVAFLLIIQLFTANRNLMLTFCYW